MFTRSPCCFLLLVLALGACGDDDASPPDAAAFDGATPEDAPSSDGTVIMPNPGEGDCAWSLGERPTAELPPEHDNEYTIELERWAIDNGRGDPVETRNRLNEAIAWAVGEGGFDKVVLPAGTYLIGEATNDIYAAGLSLPSNMTFELAEGAVIEMAPNDRWNYCILEVGGGSNITIRGGELLGDRDGHTFTGGGAHDEGHGICVWTTADHILVEDMEIHHTTGDGLLVLGSGNSDEHPGGEPSTHITIRNNHIHHNRRQGVSVVGGHNVVIANNRIHHIEGTAPQFGIDIEGAGRTDRDIHIFQNDFWNNAGGDIVTSTGRNVWIEENTMTQCQVDDEGRYDPALPCTLEEQVDGPLVHWKETDNVIIHNTFRMQMRTVNGRWAIIGYTRRDGPTRENPAGNYIAGNTFHDGGIHAVHNARYVFRDNVINEGLLLAAQLSCTRMENNRINRTGREHYKFWGVAGLAEGNVLNRTEGFPADDDIPMHFPMADDAPYRNSSPVFW